MMERLMELPIYQKDPKTNKFNPNLMTKLIRCFRSHPKIMEFSNKKFYDSDLLPKGLPGEFIDISMNDFSILNLFFSIAEFTHWATGWRFLPNKNFPVIFVPCFGESMRDEVTYSTYNESQIAIVMNYIKQILSAGINNRKVEECHIGVITPYKKQCLKLAQRFEFNNWYDIEVGTVETFQGREKPVIIISTVRSGTDNVGFLNNPKVRTVVYRERLGNLVYHLIS
jgi:helicase MOV-10